MDSSAGVFEYALPRLRGALSEPLRILDDRYAPPVSSNGYYLLRFRYLAPKPGGGFETPAELFRRVAWHLAQAERIFRPSLSDEDVLRYADSFFTVMTDFRYLPNAPALLGAGRAPQQMAACFVLPMGDSIEEIFDTLRMAAVVHSRGGGTGFSLSSVRAAGTPIRAGGVSSGPVPFLSVFDAETEVIRQGGTGWGANMCVLHCDHPDIVAFVSAKSSPGTSLRNFNLSVGITEDFMERYRSGRELPLVDPHIRQPVGRIAARELFDLICKEAWKTGDPGLLFLDRINEDNPTPQLGRIEATNPCGEAPLLPYESCCLGALNVDRFYDDRVAAIRWDDLDETAAVALRMMDNLIESNVYPLPEIAATTRRNRKVGIGIMGFADLLLRMRIPYDSEEAETLAAKLMRRIQDTTRQAAVRLAEERGSFAAFEASFWAGRGYSALRNATTTSNAPNSTISVVAGCSAGIEPLFSLVYQKHLANGDVLQEVHNGFLESARRHGFFSERLLEEVRATGSVRHARDLPADFRRLYVTAHDIDPLWHVRIQAAFQQHTDLGVSKTINLGRDATPADVRAAFLKAHELRCKGITCFRDGCLDQQFLSVTDAGTVREGAACPDCS